MKIEEVNGEELAKKFAEEMEEMLGRKMKSVKVIKQTDKIYFDYLIRRMKKCY